jgi:hypothetical protein
MQTDPFFLSSSPYMPSSSTLSLLMTPVNMVDDFCSFQKDNGGEKVYRPILCLLSTTSNPPPPPPGGRDGGGSAWGAGWRQERDGEGLGTCSSFSTPPYAVPHSALLCSAEAHIGGVRVGGRDDLVDPEWVRGPHHGGGLHGQGRR